jgi:hypothetical protein
MEVIGMKKSNTKQGSEFFGIQVFHHLVDINWASDEVKLLGFLQISAALLQSNNFPELLRE